MRKRIASMLLASVMALSVFAVGCGERAGGGAAQGGNAVKVGMATDSGTIDDKSFNEGTWKGIVLYEQENPGAIAKTYLQPLGEQHTDYVNAINELVEAGNQIIVTPGFKFETAVNEAADSHKDTKIILIDGYPHNGDFAFVEHENVVSIFFNEHEAGFLVGVAAALSTETGKLGFIGGMEIPAVQKFGWGYQAGVKYAKDKYGVNAEIIDYVYQGTFTDVAAGQTLAAGMYNKGADIIFHASGGVGVGVFNEAKERASNGQNVYVIGVDVDQYELGKYTDNDSVTLTSAMKKIDVATYNYIDAQLKGTFPGGEVITLALADKGVGLPEENPNLSEETIQKVGEVQSDILENKVKVPETQEELDEFMK